MAWVTHRKTPLVWTLSEDTGGRNSSEVNTEGYDMATFIATEHDLKVQAKVDSDANGSQDAWVNVPTDTAHLKNSDASDTESGYMRAPIPSIMRLSNNEDTTDVGFVYLELRRTASWDRGK